MSRLTKDIVKMNSKDAHFCHASGDRETIDTSIFGEDLREE